MPSMQDLMMSINLVPRHKWCDSVTVATNVLEVPVKTVILSLENDFEPCQTMDECVQRVREIHEYYIKKKACSNIPFNFLVGNDGNVYEGRGWDENPYKSEQYPDLFFEKTIDIAIIGAVKGAKLDNDSTQLVEYFVKSNIEKKYISEDHVVKAFSGEKRLF